MEEFAFLQPLLLTIIGLVIGALLKSILKHSRFPYTVGLFAIGLLVGILNRSGLFHSLPQLTEAVDSVANINPDLILYLFLPILIFDAAYELNMHIFKKTLANATLLAAPGLVICMILTGVLMVGIGLTIPGYENWTWAFALMFGALISATDPVAVVALLHELKTSKRFSTLVDAESLLNDGTGIVCFMLFFGVYAATGGSDSSPVMEFIKVISISTILGYFLARLVIWFITRINSEEMIQNSVIIVSAYVTFIISQFYLGVSGVIALVAFGLTVTYVGKPRLKPQVNKFMEHFWELATYIANTLIFIIVGIVISEKVTFSWSAFGMLILIYIFLNLFRYAMISMLYPLMKRMGYGLTKRESVILTWGGLRGALAMTLALMVSYTETIPDKCHNNALAAQQAGTDKCTFGKSKTGIQHPQAYQGEFREISGKAESQRPSDRSKLEKGGTLYGIFACGTNSRDKGEGCYLRNPPESPRPRESHLQSHIRRRYHIGNSFPPVNELAGRTL